MKYLSTTTAILLATSLIFSCTSPKEAIQKGKYHKAMKIASKNISKGKDIDLNQNYLQSAATALTDETLIEYYSINEGDIDNWKKSQITFNKALTNLGKSNVKTNGLVSESYDELCEVKYELDLKIVDFYYEAGLQLLEESKLTGRTKLARDAWQEFVSSEKAGANHFYSDLEVLKNECIEYGSIYVTAPSELRFNNQFVKILPYYTTELVDCRISIDYGFPNISEARNTNRQKISKRIKVGRNAITDTSGVTKYEDIFEKVSAYKNTTDITLTARQNIDIDVRATTSECFLRSRTRNITEDRVCTETIYTGDLRAVKNKSNSTCNISYLRNNLASDLRRELRSRLCI